MTHRQRFLLFVIVTVGLMNSGLIGCLNGQPFFPFNQLPTISSIDDQSTAVDTALLGLAFTVVDAESGAIAGTNVSATSSDATIVAASGIHLHDLGSGDFTLDLTPVASSQGTTTIMITAIDPQTALAAQKSFNLVVGGSVAAQASCRAHFNAGSTTSGVYSVDPDGAGPLAAFNAQCDMVTDGGGWTLVLNYLHQGGTNPALNTRSTDLPVIGSSTLGTDESGTGFWGHAGNALLSQFTYTEVRWNCSTGAHSRVMHFKTSLAGCISYLNTGSGDCNGLGGSFTALSGHTANLPAAMDSVFSNEGDIALTEFPFWTGGTYHWGIMGLGNRWECDDFPGDGSQNTLHRVWVR